MEPSVGESSEEARQVIQNYLTSLQLGGALYRLKETGEEVSYIDPDRKVNPATKIQVYKIVAIRNLPHQQSYRGFMEGIKAAKKLSALRVEEIVYHGTDEDAARSIAQKGFNRNKTVAHRFGYGTYHDIYGPLSVHHARDAGRHSASGKMCVIVSKIATGDVGETEVYADAPLDGCDCGASGPDRAAWMRVSFHDSQVCPQYILYITFDT